MPKGTLVHLRWIRWLFKKQSCDQWTVIWCNKFVVKGIGVLFMWHLLEWQEVLCTVGIKSIFVASDCVVDHRFIAIKGQWVGSAGPEGLICIYAPMHQGESFAFLSLWFNSSINEIILIMPSLEILIL